MAQLIDWLAFAGARTSAGAVVSSGRAWFYQPGGGTTAATIYADVDATVIALNPVTLDASGRAEVYVKDPVRIVVQDSTGADVTDSDQADVHRAEAVQLDNAGWSDSYLDDVLTKLYTSTGGVDGQYQESSGATTRTIKSKFAELSISVKDFGAKGDGITVDTTAIAAAVNRVAFLGGGEVYFPPGTYVIDQQFTISTSGVSLRGAGRNATILKMSSTTLSCLLFSGCTGFYVRDLQLVPTTNSSGTGITFATCVDCKIEGVYVHNYYVAFAGTSCTNILVGGASRMSSPSAAGASGRSFTFTDCGGVTISGTVFDCFGASSRGIELLGATGNVTVVGGGGAFTGTSVRFDTALSGSSFRFFGVALNSGNTTFSFGNPAAMPIGFVQIGCATDGYKVTVSGAGTVTPDLTKGNTVLINNTTTGAVVVAVPSPPPSTGDYGIFMTLVLYNHAGAGTTWDVTAYHVSSNPSTTDTHRTTYRFWWDPDSSVWRDVARTDTT